MQVIYEPRGRAGEFAPLAANLYRGCAHGCSYCYVPQVIKIKRDIFSIKPVARKDVLRFLEKDARMLRRDDREILMCFTSDPYQPIERDLCITRKAIMILMENGLRFTLLTKGGMLAARDFDLLAGCKKCSFKTTLIFAEQNDADWWEPHAHLLSLLQGIWSHPFLKTRFILKGGTALNLFFSTYPDSQ